MFRHHHSNDDDDDDDDATTTPTPASSWSSTKPHIVIVYGDDFGWNDVSYNADTSITNQVRTTIVDASCS